MMAILSTGLPKETDLYFHRSKKNAVVYAGLSSEFTISMRPFFSRSDI